MKELLLLRHAKSDWGDLSLPDHERPLSGRGRRAAPEMARRLIADDCVPDLVLCSTARRTRETLDLVANELADAGHEPAIEYHEDLYLASPRAMLERVRESGGSAERVMVVAHNPGTHDLAMALAADGPERQLDRMHRKFPTAALARVRFDVSTWAEALVGGGRLIGFVRPKDLDRADEFRL